MLSRTKLESMFGSERKDITYINFATREEISKSRSIQNREVATRKSFEQDVLEKIAGLEGSPSYEVIKSLVKTISTSQILPQLSGIGLEMGSGLGLLSSAVIENDEQGLISGILAVEAGLPFVETGIRFAAESTLGNLADKIIPCYGSFDEIGVESNSIDFILQIEALHHADSLAPPIVEGYRVLKDKGYFISIDRSWPNEVKDEVLEELLNHEYSKEWLDAKGFPSELPFSRRDNGEHEYRDLEWESAFLSAGFHRIHIRNLHPRFNLWHVKKRLAGLLRLNRIANVKIPSRHGVFRGIFLDVIKINQFGKYAVLKNDHPRPLTVSVWRKG